MKQVHVRNLDVRALHIGLVDTYAMEGGPERFALHRDINLKAFRSVIYPPSLTLLPRDPAGKCLAVYRVKEPTNLLDVLKSPLVSDHLYEFVVLPDFILLAQEQMSLGLDFPVVSVAKINGKVFTVRLAPNDSNERTLVIQEVLCSLENEVITRDTQLVLHYRG